MISKAEPAKTHQPIKGTHLFFDARVSLEDAVFCAGQALDPRGGTLVDRARLADPTARARARMALNELEQARMVLGRFRPQITIAPEETFSGENGELGYAQDANARAIASLQQDLNAPLPMVFRREAFVAMTHLLRAAHLFESVQPRDRPAR